MVERCRRETWLKSQIDTSTLSVVQELLFLLCLFQGDDGRRFLFPSLPTQSTKGASTTSPPAYAPTPPPPPPSTTPPPAPQTNTTQTAGWRPAELRTRRYQNSATVPFRFVMLIVFSNISQSFFFFLIPPLLQMCWHLFLSFFSFTITHAIFLLLFF